MPPFAARTLSNQDITDLYAYLETIAAPAEAVVLTGNAQAGKQLFVSDGCYECHGYVGQGGSASAGVRIGPPPISLAAVIAYIRQPSGGMPRYAKAVVSDQDVADIYAYLKTIPVPVPAKDIPLLNQ
jgi:ubiquinol-cytochrome c reductase cytochrome c subunit